MQVKREYPPNYAILQQVFPLREGNLYPWGETLYNPSGQEIPEDVMVHEAVHVKQQGDSPEDWWERYITDRDFREEQEVEAYGVQYYWIKRLTNNKIAKEAMFELADNLSSMYNLDITLQQAESKIRHKAKEIDNTPHASLIKTSNDEDRQTNNL